MAIRTEWRVVGQGAAALAGGMGVGRFAYTPILPMMHTQAGLSPRLGAGLATANYVGYLAGALAPIVVPALIRSRLALRVSLLALAASLALMPATHSGTLWMAARLAAGAASAVIFVIAVSALHKHSPHLAGWSFGGIGAGIALSGLVILALRATGTWQEAWWGATLLTALFAALSWTLPTATNSATADGRRRRRGRWFPALLASYSLEGVGYIIAGTFLVAAVEQTASAEAGRGAWVLAGLAAVPSSAVWARLSRTWSRSAMLLTALVLQAIGIALPVLVGGVAAALVSAVLFGATFLGVASITLAIGAHLRVPHAVAILTTGYSLGQILGPPAVSPLLHHGYHQALLVSAGVVAAAALAAIAVHHRFPQGDFHD